MNIPRLIYVMGIDGAGKSTVVEWLAKTLRDKGLPVEVRWLRFNHFFSKPLLGFCRLVGLTRYETVRGVRVGYHNFYRSRLVSWIFIVLQYLDALRIRWFWIAPRLRRGDRILILDRFIYDILVDVMVDTRITDLDRHPLGKAFLKLLPESALVLFVIRDKEKLLEARPESNVDRNFSSRMDLYLALSARHGLIPLQNNGDLESLFCEVAKRASIQR